MKVLAEGSPNAKIFLLGEAPGINEEKEGRPFVGGAGITLDGLLRDVGITRNECYIDNVIQERPTGGDFKALYTDKARKLPTQELKEAHQRIQNLVQTHKPNVVVALGQEPLQALTGLRGIMNWRGSILSCGGVKVIPTIHPATVMRQYNLRQVVACDLTRVKRESSSPEIPKYTDNFITSPTFDQCIHYLRNVLPGKPYVSFDIETIPDMRQITCLGFGWSKEDAICIPIFYGASSWWNSAQELELVKCIREFFAKASCKFIAQNAQYDMVYMKDKWGVDLRLWMDTMTAFHTAYPEFKKSLAFINSIYTNRPYYKMMRSSKNPSELWHYNCLDNVVTWECAMEIRKDLEEYGTLEFYETHSREMIYPLMRMQRNGVLIDANVRRKMDENFTREIDKMQLRLNFAVGYELNVNSPKQMQHFLYKDMNFPVQKKRVDGVMKVTTDEDALENLAIKFPTPVLKLICDIRHAQKLLSTYIQAPLSDDGRMRCAFSIDGTVTGRLSSRSDVYGSGTNLQNIPRGPLIRSLFVADPGFLFANPDFSQAEARLVAYLANEQTMKKIFSDPSKDIHKQMAGTIFRKRVDEVLPHERQTAKSLVHAANYGIGPRKFAQLYGGTELRARELLNQYYAIFPAIKLWHMRVKEKLSAGRTLTTPLGRKRTFFGRFDDSLIREAIAYVPQSTVSDVLNIALNHMDSNLPPGFTLHIPAHDSILLQYPEATAPMHLYKFISYFMRVPITVSGETFYIPIDIQIGRSWGQMHKIKLTNDQLTIQNSKGEWVEWRTGCPD